MEKIFYHGIDIGSANIKIIALSLEDRKVKVVYKNSYPSTGVSKGYISNLDLFNQSLKSAIKKFEKESKTKISEAVFTIDSYGLKSKNLKISHQTINQLNVSEVDLSEIERKINISAKKNISGKILNLSLVKYKVNSFDYFSSIEGLDAKKIEAEYSFAYLPQNHILNLEKIAANNDILILDIYVGNIISAKTDLENEDKKLGVLTIDLGAEKTIFSIWEEGNLFFIDSLNYGSTDISKKISLQEKIAFSEAEKLKKAENEDWVKKITKDESKELAEKIKEKLIDLKRNDLLPAGAILFGGGSKSNILRDVFKDVLEMPIKKFPKNLSDSNTDYHNIYSSLVYHIKKEENGKIFDFSKIKNLFNKMNFLK